VEEYYAPCAMVNVAQLNYLSAESSHATDAGRLSDVIAQHQFLRMGFEVNLPFQVTD
jgi:hypothetical protein